MLGLVRATCLKRADHLMIVQCWTSCRGKLRVASRVLSQAGKVCSFWDAMLAQFSSWVLNVAAGFSRVVFSIQVPGVISTFF